MKILFDVKRNKICLLLLWYCKLKHIFHNSQRTWKPLASEWLAVHCRPLAWKIGQYKENMWCLERIFAISGFIVVTASKAGNAISIKVCLKVMGIKGQLDNNSCEEEWILQCYYAWIDDHDRKGVGCCFGNIAKHQHSLQPHLTSTAERGLFGERGWLWCLQRMVSVLMRKRKTPTYSQKLTHGETTKFNVHAAAERDQAQPVMPSGWGDGKILYLQNCAAVYWITYLSSYVMILRTCHKI